MAVKLVVWRMSLGEGSEGRNNEERTSMMGMSCRFASCSGRACCGISAGIRCRGPIILVDRPLWMAACVIVGDSYTVWHISDLIRLFQDRGMFQAGSGEAGTVLNYWKRWNVHTRRITFYSLPMLYLF